MTYDIISLLERLNYPITIRGENCVCPTHFRGGNNSHGLFVNSSGFCYDQVQGRTFKLVEFVSEVLGCSIAEAQKFIGSNQSAAPVEKEPSLELAPKFDTKDIENLTPSFKFYLDKGISRETLLTFDAGFAHGGRFYGRVVFPVKSKNKVIGAAGRDVLARDVPKWKICGKKKTFIYPLAQAGPYISKTRKIILIESIGDLLNLWENGVKNALVLFGTSLSDDLLRAIVAQNPAQILLGLNNDIDKDINRGQEATNKVREKLSKWFSPKIIVDGKPPAGDFGQLKPEEIRAWAEAHNVERF